MPTTPSGTFELPDTIAALPERPFEFSPAARDRAATILSGEPAELFSCLMNERESEVCMLVARHVIAAFLRHGNALAAPTDTVPDDADADAIAEHVAAVRDVLAVAVSSLARLEPDLSLAVARQRAPLAMLGGCWLDVVSQPATQPSIIVNRLFAHHFAQRGAGSTQRSVHLLRRRALEAMRIYLPDLAAVDFLRKAEARPLTTLHACFYLALSRLPANFLPELIGVHYAFHALGIDDLVCGTTAAVTEEMAREVVAEYLSLTGPSERRRLHAAIRLTLAMERQHVAMLAELASWRAGLSLESKVAEIIARHAPLAGRQHGALRVGDRLLSETFADPKLDLAEFLASFRESGYVQPSADGSCRFIRAMKFGGPMFGIFDEREAAIFRAWVASVHAGERPKIEISTNEVGDEEAQRWRTAIARNAPADVVVADANPRDHRELFYRLVNIENFANTLPLASERAERCFQDAEILFTYGAAGKYTDATYFDYSPEALYERAERIYWDKLVNPYEPLEEVPDRDEVVFIQTTYHLGYLIDGAWLHRLEGRGHSERNSDGLLFAIYADEMGHGDLRKNHITLTHQVMASMGIKLPHIRDAAFMEQAELPDELYGYAIQQLCMCLFPDRFYNEILGYNLAIEMFGSGELRLHEIQKLRHHGFDDCYEQAHLAIDNFSAGHTRQAADIIVCYLDEVRRTFGDSVVQEEWRRIWRGYASFAYFVEHQLVKQIQAGRVAADEAGDDAVVGHDARVDDGAVADLVI